MHTCACHPKEAIHGQQAVQTNMGKVKLGQGSVFFAYGLESTYLSFPLSDPELTTLRRLSGSQR